MSSKKGASVVKNILQSITPKVNPNHSSPSVYPKDFRIYHDTEKEYMVSDQFPTKTEGLSKKTGYFTSDDYDTSLYVFKFDPTQTRHNVEVMESLQNNDEPYFTHDLIDGIPI
eukprot:TRINITY_DN17052_c0_g1_i1.p1 TRINITY_DN17052_c0_g1~~TRINITY_DN17052_c0_g1_i1.p1  ORF type:complete len:121 (+),score=21.28 TRINITY_DN17052_c0_g1_i1:27-365(+)